MVTCGSQIVGSTSWVLVGSLGVAVCGVCAAADGESSKIEEIVVTATYRDLSLLEVPLSVTALSGENLAQLGADDLQGFADYVPGLEFSGFAPGLNRITIRGISTQTGESSTSLYVDEMPVSSDPTAMPDVKIFDVNRVEVLRGPQGTLFGEASLGGTVRILMNQPDASASDAVLEASTSHTSAGGWNESVDAMVNIPVVPDQLALRVVASGRWNDGYLDDVLGSPRADVNDEQSVGLRAALSWSPSAALKITGTVHYTDLETGGEFVSNEDWQQFKYTPEPRDDTSRRYNLTINYDLPWADLVSSTSYFTRDTLRNIDQTGPALGLIPPGVTVAQVFDIDYRTFVQEVRLVSNQEGRLDWVAGAFFRDNERTSLSSTVTQPSLGPLLEGNNEYRFKQWAVFGELTWHLTDRLSAVTGLRYFEEDDEFSVDTFGLLTGPGFRNTSDAQADEVTPRVTLQYDFDADAMLYVTASKGFRTGGANPTKPIFDLFGIPLPSTFAPDTIWNYELGGKWATDDQRLVVSSAIYYMDWQDVQLPALAGVFNGTFNAGEASSKGVELELTARPTERLSLRVAANYTDAQIERTVTAPGPLGPVPVATEGNELPLVPEWKASVGAEYRWAVTGAWSAAIRANGAFVPERFNLADNNPAERLRSYSIFDLSASLESDRYDVTLFADNLTNEVVEYAYLGDPSLPDERLFAVGRPRTIGVTARVRF